VTFVQIEGRAEYSLLRLVKCVCGRDLFAIAVDDAKRVKTLRQNSTQATLACVFNPILARTAKL
jgi:hypothetical protein